MKKPLMTCKNIGKSQRTVNPNGLNSLWMAGWRSLASLSVARYLLFSVTSTQRHRPFGPLAVLIRRLSETVTMVSAAAESDRAETHILLKRMYSRQNEILLRHASSCSGQKAVLYRRIKLSVPTGWSLCGERICWFRKGT